MSILTRITNIPLFDNIKQALHWGAKFNLNSYHKHTFEGQTGYMAGKNHVVTTTAFNKYLQTDIDMESDINMESDIELDVTGQPQPPQQPLPPPPQPIQQPIQQPTVTTTTTTTGGGGGGGY